MLQLWPGLLNSDGGGALCAILSDTVLNCVYALANENRGGPANTALRRNLKDSYACKVGTLALNDRPGVKHAVQRAKSQEIVRRWGAASGIGLKHPRRLR